MPVPRGLCNLGRPPAAQNSCDSGIRSSETENGCNGERVRPGSGNVFDGIWRNLSVRATLTMTPTGSQVAIGRQDNDGAKVEYVGTIGPDGRTVTGSGRIVGAVPAGAPSGPYPFRATIDCGL